MKMRVMAALAITSLALVAVDIVAATTSRHADYHASTLAMALATGLVYVVAGLIAAARRPGSRVGPLMCLAGIVLMASLLGQSNHGVPFTIGLVSFWIPSAVIAHIILTFPTGHIGSWTERLLIGASYLNALVIVPSIWLFLDPQNLYCPGCPRNLLLLHSDVALADRISSFNTWFAAGVALVMVGVLAYRSWNATAAGRRVLGPPLWVGVALTTEFIVISFHGAWLSPRSSFFWVDQTLTVAYPLAFLLGLLRTRISRSRWAIW